MKYLQKGCKMYSITNLIYEVNFTRSDEEPADETSNTNTKNTQKNSKFFSKY